MTAEGPMVGPESGRWRAALCAAVWLIASAGAAASQSLAELPELPRPALDGEEAQVREQLQQLRAQLDQLLVVAGRDPADAEATTRVAEQFAQLGELYYLYDLAELSEVAFDNALSLRPTTSSWRYLRGVARAVNGRALEAIDDFGAVLRSDPASVPTLIRRGDLLFDNSRYAEARADYQRARDLAPEQAAPIAGLGHVAHRLGEHEEAVELLREALTLQPGADSLNYPLAFSLRALGEMDEARAALARNDQGRLTFPDPLIDRLGLVNRSSQALMHAANEAMRGRDMEEAEELFRRFLMRRPDHAVAMHNLGLTQLAQQKREAGLRSLQRSVELDPEFRGGHYFLAAALAEEGRLDEALFHYKTAHRLDPEERAIHADYATLLARMGKTAEALASLRPVVEADPQAAYLRLKYATILSAAGRFAEARPLFVALSTADNQATVRGEALYHLAVDALNSGRKQEAVELLTRSLQDTPASAASNRMMAQLHAEAGRLPEAVANYRNAVRAEPVDARSQFGLAMGLLLLDRDQEARSSLEEALATMPAHRGLRHALARLLASSSEDEVRDGPRALEMIEALLQEERRIDYVETLAMALAETGRYEEAVTWQQRVLAQAETAQRRARMEGYRQGVAARDPWESG